MLTQQQQMYFYQNIVNSTSEHLSLVDTDYRYVVVNKAYLQAHNIKLDEIIGKSVPEIIGEEAFEGFVKEKLDACFKGERINFEMWFDFAEIGRRFMGVSYSPSYDGDQNLLGAIVNFHDLTERKRMEEELVASKERIEKLSNSDGLTGLYNRRFFDALFPRQLKSANRADIMLAFAMLDIDFFKKYNDTYGHLAGDKALQQVAAVLKKIFKREDDYCFRTGGEEFIFLYTVSTKNDAYKLAETVRSSIEGLNIEHAGSSVSPYITASIGVFIIEPNTQLSMDSIYKSADTLLYHAKNSGRNRVR
ncbi:MAG: sensor domain-containing diguanylate cyclase [Thermodesulfobacteriota bacterium]